MSLVNLEPHNCAHNFFPNMSIITNSADLKEPSPKIYFCKLCGVLKIDSKILRKPEQFRYPCEADPLNLISDIIENSINLDIPSLNINFLKQRQNLIAYMRRSCKNFKFSEETFHQAVDYLDTILIQKSTKESKFDLIAIGCITLAEVHPDLPNNKNFLKNSKGEFHDAKDIINAELTCLKLLNYKLNTYSAYSIIKYFLNNGIVYSGKMSQISELYLLCFEISNEAVFHSGRFIFSNLQIALASIGIACIMYKNSDFPYELFRVLGQAYNCTYYDFNHAMEFVEGIYQTMQMNGRFSLSNCRQRSEVNKHLARCSIELNPQENTEEEKSTRVKSNSQKRIKFNDEPKETVYEPNKEANEKLSKTEECILSMVPIMQSKEYIITNEQSNCNLPENQNSSSKEIPYNTNHDSSESTCTLISNVQTPIKSNVSTNLSLHSTVTQGPYVDVSDREEESNYLEIAEKEKES